MDMRVPAAWRGYIPCLPWEAKPAKCVCSPKRAWHAASREQIHAKDVVTELPKGARSGLCCLPQNSATHVPLTAFGHPGMGGSLGFADPAKRLAMGYVMNKMIFGLDTRYINLCHALYSCLKP